MVIIKFIQDNNGYSPLHVVVRNGETMMVRMLIEAVMSSRQALFGNDSKLMEMIRLPAHDGTTPFHIAKGTHRHCNWVICDLVRNALSVDFMEMKRVPFGQNLSIRHLFDITNATLEI